MKLKLVACALSIGVVVAGCELIVDFDRTKIPQPVTDASLPDVVQPVVDAGPDVGRDATSTDASDASDAASDADPDAEADAM